MALLKDEKLLRIGRQIKSLLEGQRLILASASPRRKQILSEIGLTFQTYSPNIEEDINSSPPDVHVKYYALKKAQTVAKQVESGIILAADTMVVLESEVLGKPKDPDQAQLMLKKLSGKVHTVFTGVAVLNKAVEKEAVDFQSTRVVFNQLTPQAIQEYLATGEFVDKAGAYGIQGMGSFLVKEIIGDLDNVIGLPLASVKRLLEEVL